ncbi:Protein PER1 [Nakaseomyces bracarensis]|uniref:Post-GPI attachment to proteins factor 3 n=1 Tax=Nakaseomyces bracarensis TaxID=273131 RepID=A0ABR4NM22_9SACH
MKVPYLLCSAVLVSGVLCSPGDQLDEFIDCTCACEYYRHCKGSGINYIDPNTNDFHNVDFISLIDNEKTWVDQLVSKVTFWDCMAECDYVCQQMITEDRVKKGDSILQFHGKWPFKKMFGFQEFFASIFSIGNFVSQYRGYKMIRRRMERQANQGNSDKYYDMLLQSYLFVSIMGMMAWLSSTVFHFRDLLVTEKFDYFFAGGTVLTAFHAILNRVAYKKINGDIKYTVMQVVRYATLAIFICHILRLYIDWSYTYNMRFNICFGVLQYLILIYVAIDNHFEIGRHSKYAYPPDRFKLVYLPIILVVFTALAMSLELFDNFSIAWQLDSHATWHLLTILPGWYLFDFFLYDLDFILHRKTV